MTFEEMENLELSDLIGVPYLDHGRDLNGLDCYGVAIIAVYITTRKKLRDVVYQDHNVELSQKYAPTLNVQKTDELKTGNIVEMTINNRLHIGVLINDKEVIHATKHGVRISPINHLPIINIYGVL